jgi:aryl-alcohol dehydrogenase-like predicted oxidoreductase
MARYAQPVLSCGYPVHPVTFLSQELGWKREDIVVSTKVFWGGDGPNDKGLSRKHIIEGTRNCLKRLQLDYV